MLLSQITGMLGTLVIGLALGEQLPAGRDLVLCAIAGVLGAAGILALYHGLAVGRMGVVAPVTGVLAAVIPVVAGFVTEGVPGPLVVLGIALAVVAVILVSRVADESGGRSGLQEALFAGTAIGLFGVVIAQLSEGNVFLELSAIRFFQGVLVVLGIVLLRRPWRPAARILPALVAIGILDTAGNALYLMAVQTGQLAIASVLSAMYPVATIVLAMTFLREPISRDHTIGIVLAVVATALIASGG